MRDDHGTQGAVEECWGGWREARWDPVYLEPEERMEAQALSG